MNANLFYLRCLIKPCLRIVFIAVFLVGQFNFSTARSFDTKELATVCKIWGFLKYHHPIVAKGKLNWDEELLNMLGNHEVHEFNPIMVNWINRLNRSKKYYYAAATNKLNNNESLKWINADSLIDDSLRNLLWQVYYHRINSSSYYVKPFFINGTVMFKNEKHYADMDYSNLNMRLLAISRYWNAINYFYPYLTLIDSNWNSVLPLAIDKMKSISSRDEYINTLRWLVKKTSDGHNNLSVFYSFKRDSFKWTPYSYKVWNNKIWVDGFYTHKIDFGIPLRIGDEIVSVNNQTAIDHIQYWMSNINASNNSGLLNYVSYYVLSGYDSLVNLKIRRHDSLFDATIKRYTEGSLISFQSNISEVKDSIINNIPYLNLASVSKKEIELFIKTHFESRAMIVDLRNYPKDDPKVVFAKYLLSERKKFAEIKLMDVYNPGGFRRMKKDSSIFDYSWIGAQNKKVYQGKVVLLVDANTISHAEFTAMAMQVMPQVTVIGSQTGGANGNVTTLLLPGNIKTSISGIGVSYPDGSQSQRKGIKLNIEVTEPSTNNLKSGDVIFKTALNLLNQL